MRRADLIPLALLAVLGGAVGFRAIQRPRIARPPVVVGPIRPTPALPRDEDEPMEVVHRAGGSAPAPAVFIPNARSEEILHRIRMGAAGTYMFEMLEGDSSITRWSVRPTEPIRVWVDPAPGLADWNPRFASAARDGFKGWNAAGLPIRMNFLVDSTDAEVRVHWADQLEEKRVGVARRVRDQDYWIVSAEIVLALHEPGGRLLTAEALRSIAAHEAGHMLGLGHSPFGLDIMAAGYSSQVEPSGADLNTMRLLYTIPPGRFR